MKAFRQDGKYTWGGQEYPSVTTILSVIAKPALVYWAGKVVAEEAVRVANEQGIEALDARSLAAVPGKVKDAKAGVGTIVHSVLEAHAAGRRVALGQVPESARAYASALLRWIDESGVEVLRSEATVFSDFPRYAGTLDAIIRLDGETLIADVKTGKSVYKEAWLQLAAYEHAGIIGYADGSSEKMPKVSGAVVIHVRETGVKVVRCPYSLWDAYMAFRCAYSLWRFLGGSEAGKGEAA